MLAPICLFTYNRPNETIQTVEALKKNYLATESDIFIFSDGPKSDESSFKVNQVREYLKTITGFNTVTIFESIVNKGLANSIITGVTQIIEKYGKVIVVEDDLVTSPNFLDFLNQGLNFYLNDPKIFSISGYTFNLPSLINYPKDYFLGYRASSLGWGTWFDRWNLVDWEALNYKQFVFNPFKHIKFMRGGSDMPYLLWKQMNGKIDSWAIRWCFHQFRKKMLTVYPSKSKLFHIGLGSEATHAKKTNMYDTIIDTGIHRNFKFDNETVIDPTLAKEFRHIFSFSSRFKNKIFQTKN